MRAGKIAMISNGMAWPSAPHGMGGILWGGGKERPLFSLVVLWFLRRGTKQRVNSWRHATRWKA
jgi:hypothetical protein